MRCLSSFQCMDRLKSRFARLYGEEAAPACLRRLEMLAGRYGVGLYGQVGGRAWDQSDAVLITYADTIRREGEVPLQTLHRFVEEFLPGAVSIVHLLPFFPSSSDDGFSVLNYRNVDSAVGTWEDVQALGRDFRLMFDLVLNHASAQSGWFRDYVQGIAPARHYFLEADPALDWSAVVRPRSLPLLTPVQKREGERHVWTTFSPDQVDLNFAQPDVLFEFLDLLLFYIAQGAQVIRLDAIAFLWKKQGTSCLHLPETHEVVKLLRDFVDMVAPSVRLLTETNVPHEENVSYFGEGDEAHMVYQFSLPPLVLHALVRGEAGALTAWAQRLSSPPPGCAYFNFTASHDGIGLRPLQGLVPPDEIEQLVRHVRRVGGLVSTRSAADGTETPYELNVSYFDALGGPRVAKTVQAARFLCSQTIALALRGVPGVYFHSLTATRNDLEGVRATGRARSINRHRWDDRALRAALADPRRTTAGVFTEYVRRLRLRARHAAFHPDGPQRVVDLGPAFFAVVREAPDGRERVLAVSSVTANPGALDVAEAFPETDGGKGCPDWLSGKSSSAAAVQFAPYQTRWIELPPAP